MTKKVIILSMIAVFLLSATAFAVNKSTDRDYARSSIAHKTPLLFSPGGETESYGSFGKPYVSQSLAQTFAPTRQLYNNETTQRERQHYTTMGRQISYAGYFNAACDYVYFDYSWSNQVGSTDIFSIKFGVFNWVSGVWDYTVGGIADVSPTGSSNTCNVETDPRSGYSVVAYHHAADPTSTYYSLAGTSTGCLGYDHISNTDTLFGPPNLDGINTGYCGDDDPATEPYAWPNLSVDTLSDGKVVTHVVSTKFGGCDEVANDDSKIETKSLVYWRRVSDNLDQPWTGSWDGPYLIDSVYINTGVVVSDLNSDDVYIAYLRPIYYQTGTTSHPCSNNEEFLGFYQFTHEVVYKKSTNNGQSWGAFQKVTDFESGYLDEETDPAWYDIDAMVDPNGNLHIVWGTRSADEEDVCSGGFTFAAKLWHWDSGNNCISIAYDASHPAFFSGASDIDGAWNIVVSKYNVSWCDNKLYISFTRFGSHAIGDTAIDYGASGDYMNADIYVVGSDATGEMGKTWTDGINLTDTESDSCLPGECFSEHWPSMAMYSSDSLMIEYIEDKDPGAFGSNDTSSLRTDNPIMFMTWPCFTMADVGSNVCLTTSPANTIYPEIALAPNGNTSGCTTPATYSDQVELNNCGNTSLSYSTSSNSGWLTINSGASGPISAGVGPRYSNNPNWTGAPGCAAPATIEWEANSSSLGQGNYSGAITVDIDDASVDDFDITVNLVVACEYYLPEFATVSSGCWSIDLYTTPQAGSGTDNNSIGNMTYYACGADSTLHPLYSEALIVGWKLGSDLYVYTDNSDDHMGDLLPASLPAYQRLNARMRALGEITVTDNTEPVQGTGYYQTEGYFCTPDSVVYGKAEYYVPFNQDTAVVIEKVMLWNESGATLNEFLVGEGIDWDVEIDSNFDAGGFDPSRGLVFQYGAGAQSTIYAGLAPYSGQDGSYGGAVLDNPAWIYPDTGYNIVDIYDTLTNLDGGYSIFSDSNTDLNSVFRFYEGTMNPGDTITICKVKAISLDGETGLQTLIDKGFAFIENYGICEAQAECLGLCGDANDDDAVNVSDAVWIINYVFIGGGSPQPVLACGDANSDGAVNVSDAVWVINYVFIGGAAPGDCSPGSWAGNGGDCCPF